MNVSAYKGSQEKEHEARMVKSQLATKYFTESFIPLFPALRATATELSLTRGEILLLLSAKAYQRKNPSSFTAKGIEAYTFVSYKNLNSVLNKLTDNGFLKLEERGHKFSDAPTRFRLSLKGLKVVTRLDDLVMAFTYKLSA